MFLIDLFFVDDHTSNSPHLDRCESRGMDESNRGQKDSYPSFPDLSLLQESLHDGVDHVCIELLDCLDEDLLCHLDGVME